VAKLRDPRHHLTRRMLRLPNVFIAGLALPQLPKMFSGIECLHPQPCQYSEHHLSHGRVRPDLALPRSPLQNHLRPPLLYGESLLSAADLKAELRRASSPTPWRRRDHPPPRPFKSPYRPRARQHSASALPTPHSAFPTRPRSPSHDSQPARNTAGVCHRKAPITEEASTQSPSAIPG